MPKETTPSVAEQADERARFHAHFNHGFESKHYEEMLWECWCAALAASQAASHSAPEPVATVHRGGLGGQWGKATTVVRWEAGAESLPDGEHMVYAGPVSVVDSTWARYIAGMIETYLNFDNPKQGREAAIAGIIERRMWSAPPAPLGAESKACASVGEPVAQWIEEALTYVGSPAWSPSLEREGRALLATLATPPAAPAVTEGAGERSDALYDSAWVAGAGAGWNAALKDNDPEALNKLIESRTGYLGVLKRTRAHAAAVPESPAWIDVKDRVPTHLYSVLGVVTDGPFVVQGDPEDRMRDVVSYSPERACWLQHDGNDSVVVTVSHWQEMADLP